MSGIAGGNGNNAEDIPRVHSEIGAEGEEGEPLDEERRHSQDPAEGAPA